jgi:hypothetical protein
MKDLVIEDLVQLHPSVFVSKWILERIPHEFGADQLGYNEWRRVLAAGIGVDPCAIVLTGSSSVGISLNPDKDFKEFHRRSDIDIAVISSCHFEIAWRCLRNLGTAYARLAAGAKRSVDEHRNKYIYFGTVATDQILGLLPFGREWQSALSRMAGIKPTEGREIKARLYRDFDSLRGYQVSNVRNLSNKVNEARLRGGHR